MMPPSPIIPRSPHQICRSCADKQGQALAYHSLGASYQLLAQTGGTADDLKTALYFHSKHRKIADSVGKRTQENRGQCG